ncbi:MAG: hypothetical protein RLZZ347_198 [Candidatus Parcubacteria bacterium]
MATKKYPPVSPGTTVRTTKPNHDKRSEWTDGAWEKRRWKITGTVITHSDAHGLCYKVQHKGGHEAWYDPSEFVVVPAKKKKKKAK